MEQMEAILHPGIPPFDVGIVLTLLEFLERLQEAINKKIINRNSYTKVQPKKIILEWHEGRHQALSGRPVNIPTL